MERRGVPAALVATDRFLPMAQYERKNLGVPNLPIVVLPYPVSGTPREEALAKADAALGQAAAALLGRLSQSEEGARHDS